MVVLSLGLTLGSPLEPPNTRSELSGTLLGRLLDFVLNMKQSDVGVASAASCISTNLLSGG